MNTSKTTTAWRKLTLITSALILSACCSKAGVVKVPDQFMSTPKASYLLSEAPVQVSAKKLVEDTTMDAVMLSEIQAWLRKMKGE